MKYVPGFDLQQVVQRALAYALDNLQNNGPFYCIVVSLPPLDLKAQPQWNLQRFPANSFEESLEAAREYVRASSSGLSRYAIVYDGYLSLEGKRHSVVFVEAGGHGHPKAQLFAQPYLPKAFLRRAQYMGDLTALEAVPSMLKDSYIHDSSGVWLSRRSQGF